MVPGCRGSLRALQGPSGPYKDLIKTTKNNGKNETMTKKVMKHTLKYPLGIPIGFPGKPGSLGLQMERRVKENKGNQTRKTTKNGTKRLKQSVEIALLISLGSQMDSQGSQELLRAL